jgi:hypothetical protein
MAQPVSMTVRAVAIPRLDQGAIGIHLAWSGPELSPLGSGGYEIRRRPHRESKTKTVCAQFDTQRLARLAAQGVLPDELGVMLLHNWRPGTPGPVTAAAPAPVVIAAVANLPWSVFTQELATPATQVSVSCSAESAFAIAVSGEKSVAFADIGPAGGVTLTGPSIDTVVVYARRPTALSVCAVQPADPAADQASWATAEVIASGLTLPLHETDPSLADAAQELARGRSRLVGTETLTAEEAEQLAAALRPGVTDPQGRPCDRVLLDRTDTDASSQETVFSTRLGLITLDPRLRRVLGFGFADRTAIAGVTYDYRVSGLFDPADIADTIYDVHQIPSGTALPSTFRIGDITLRLGAPTEVVLDPVPDSAALSAVSRRGIAINRGGPIDGFVPWWPADLACVIDLPVALQHVTFEVPASHHLSCAGVSSANPATVAPAPIPPGPSASVTFPAPVDQLRIAGSGTLYALRLPGSAGDGQLNCVCGPVQLAAQPLPAPPTTVTVTNLQSPPTILTGDITEGTPVADRPQPGFRVTWAPATLGGGGAWPGDLAADPPTDSLAYLIEHRRVYPNNSTDPWEPIQAGDNLTFGSWPASSGPPSLGYGVDLDAVFPLHRQRQAGADVTMSVTDLLTPDAKTDDPPRAAAPLGSSHQYRIRAMDVVGRASGAWTESAVVRLEKHIPPPLPAGPQPEPALVGTPPRPSGPMGVQARTILASDPTLSSADTALLAGHQCAVVLSWGWRPAERELDPSTTEFRIYLQPDIPTTVPGTVTSVSQATNQWVLGFTTDRTLIADECAGMWLTSGGQAFRIVTHTAGSTPTITVAASLVHPAVAPQAGPVTFGRPLAATHQRPASWQRVAVVPLTSADTYSQVLFDLLSVSAAAPTDEAWVGVSAADAEPYVGDEIPAAQPNGGRPGNESSIAAVTASARYRGRPEFSIPPPLGDVPELVTDEPTGRQLAVTLDASALLGGAAVSAAATVALDRCPLDAVLKITRLAGNDVVLTRADGTQQVVAFPNPSDEATVRAGLASDHPERLDTRYVLFLLCHFDSPQELFSPTGALQTASALSDQLPPKPGRYFYRVRLADASGAVSTGGAILPVAVRVPSIAPMPAPTRRTVSVADGILSVGLALQPDPELAWLLLFYRVGDWATAPPDPADAQLLRMPNRRDLYPGGGLRLRLVDGTLLAPTTADVAGAGTDSDGLLDLPITVTLTGGTPGQPRWVRYWCYGLSRDGIPSQSLGPFTVAVGASS